MSGLTNARRANELPQATTYRTKLRRKGQLTLPGPVRDALFVDVGDDLEFVVNEDGTVIVRGWTSIPADQKLFWVAELQKKENQAGVDQPRMPLV